MIKNYFLSLIRYFNRNKFYSLINLLGLAIGIAASILILLFVFDELSYDTHHEKANRIYRLEANFKIKDKHDNFAITQFPLGPTLKDEYPEVVETARIFPSPAVFFRIDNREIEQDSLYIADSTYFSIFDHAFISGSPATALNRPNTIVLSQSLAHKLFGNENPMGKTIPSIEGDIYEVTGVFKDIPHNAHLQYNGLISSMTIAEQIGREQFESREPGAFWNVQIYTYVLLEKNATIHSLLEKSPDFYEKYMKSLGDQINASFALDATALTDIYLSKKDLQFDVRKGNRSFIYIFSVVAFLILIMAVINYMSLSTARSTLRFREIGMKKVVGAHKHALIFQFISESLIFSFAALFIALFFVILLLPVFNQLSGKAIDTGYLLDPIIVTGIILIGIFVGLLSGSYPAFYLSSFNPVTVLKGKGFSEMNGTARFRRSLVVVQFAISVLMIIGTLTISRQLNYIQHKDIGYNTEDVVILTLRDTTLQNSVTAFKNELKKIPGVISVSSSSTVPIYGYGKQVMRVEDENGEMVETALNNYFIDQEYLGVMELELAEGRNYSREMTSDMNSAFLINETAARHLGWAGVDSTTEKVKYSYKNTIGKRIHYGFDLEGNIARNGKVVGVIKDFNFSTLHNPIEPIILLLGDEQNMQYLSIRIRPDNTKQILSDIESLEDEFNTAFPFNYRLLDNEIANLYKDDRNINRIFRYMTILTIIIAVLGLLGLSAYMAGQRTKEIGIRKVIGATELQVVFMLMQDFSKWVIIANIIAIPVAYYAIQRWLQDFVYRVETSWWLFGLGFLISLVIALITVSWYSLKVAMQNPTDSLKFE